MRPAWLILFSICCNVLGQLLIKRGIVGFGKVELQLSNVIRTAFQVFTVPMVSLGIIVYFVSAFFWITALSKVELSYAYPLLSIGYVLVLFFSHFLFRESLNLHRLIGTALIVAGIYFISKS